MYVGGDSMNRKNEVSNKRNKVITVLSVLIVLFVILNVYLCYRIKNEQLESADSDITITTVQRSKSSKESTLSTFESTSVTQNVTNETAVKKTTAENTVTTKNSFAETTYENPYDSERITVDPKDYNWNLIVVNASREIPDGYVPALKEILSCGKYLDERVAPYYEKMYYAAKEDGITLTPYSAYRSYDRQKLNYENLTKTYMKRYGISQKEAAKKAASVILPPGTSEHNLGLAVDICNTLDSFANSKEYAWLCENAYKYGFILRYTKEKQQITGIVPEPWHWRFVGTEYAKEIRDSGLCLEEWLDSKGIAY